MRHLRPTRWYRMHVRVLRLAAVAALGCGTAADPELLKQDKADRKAEYHEVVKSLESDTSLTPEERQSKRQRLEMDYGDVMTQE